jgi:hypothetical protein
MKRPSLNPINFLKHLFAPKSNALPTGIRARKLTGTKGRSKARLAAYNRMSGPSQEILRQSGLRDAYLKGEASLKDARGELRGRALKHGIAKPTKAEKAAAEAAKGKKRAVDAQVDHAAYVASKVAYKLRDAGRKVNFVNMVANLSVLSTDALDAVEKLDVAEIRAYAGDENNTITLPSGRRINPLWYN